MTLSSPAIRYEALLAFLFSMSGLVHGQKLCQSDQARFAHLNATGTYAIPGLSPPGHPNGTWDVSTGVVASSAGKDVQQAFWIDTSPTVNIVSNDLPWTGCFFAFTGLPGKTNQFGFDDDGDCTSIFDKSCVEAFTAAIQQTAQSLSGQNGTDFDCNVFSQIKPNACKKFNGGPTGTGGSVSTDIGAPRGSQVSRNCTPSLGTGSAVNNSLFSIGFADGTGDGGYEAYDAAVTGHSPVIISAWLKNTTTTAQPWGDGRLLCMRPQNVTAGSRNATEVPSKGVMSQARSLTLLGTTALLMIVYLGFG